MNIDVGIRYESHPESKERLCIQSAHLFCCSRSLVSDVQWDVEKLPHAVVRRTLSRVKCRDSCGHSCADWESRWLWGVIRFQQADEILGYLSEEASSRVEVFRCTTMHVRILPGIHKPCCVTIPLGHLRASFVQAGPDIVGLFPVSKNEEAPCW